MIVDRYVVDEYLKGIDNRNTKKTYASSLRHFLDFINKAHIIHIDQENINQVIHDYKSYLLGRYTKPKTINQHLMTAKTFFSDYTNLRIRKLKLLKVEQKEPHYLTQSQLHLVLENIDDDLNSIIIRLLAYTGLRITEALGIKKRQLKNKTPQGDAIVSVIGKNRKKRVIVIPSKLTKELEDYSRNNTSECVFQSRNLKTKPITPRTIQRHLKQLGQELDLKYDTDIFSINLKPHNLRHSFAIHALKSHQINYVKEFLGHESITTTQIYTNLKEEDVIDKFASIGEYAD